MGRLSRVQRACGAACIAVLCWGCGGPGAVSGDAGSSPADAGVVDAGTTDSGLVSNDAGASDDAGSISAVDAGPAGDAGGGTPGFDGGTPWPKWVFTHWVWEGESTAASAQALLDDYAAHDIPVGALIVDSPWETGYNTLEWDTALFPDPKAFVDNVHARGVRLVLWIVPGVNTDVQPLYDELKGKQFFMQKLPLTGPGVVSWWKGKGSLLDYFNPEAVAWWHGRLDTVLAYGIDGWKCDGLDFSVSTTPYSPGKGSFANHAQYASAYYRDFFDYTRAKLGPERVITARPVDMYGYDLGPSGVGQATFAPRDLNWVGWVGDQDATFKGLSDALLNMYYSSTEGYLGFGSDIGGYRTDDTAPGGLGRTKELFIRWAQLGAFSPLMENGGSGEHRPWAFDAETTDIYRVFVKLHLALGEYLNREGLVAWQAHRSLVTYLDKGDYRFMLGRDLFVAPMLASGTSRAVSFPPGASWVYLFDKSKTYAGGTTATVTVPLAEYPVFLKQGSDLASQLTVPVR